MSDDMGFLCLCGNFEESGFHCADCGREPPWGCDCSQCTEPGFDEDFDDRDDTDDDVTDADLEAEREIDVEMARDYYRDDGGGC